jgi:hypothetical protein
VHGTEHEPAARPERSDHPPHLGPDLVRRPVGEHVVRVHAAAEHEPVAEPALEPREVRHAAGGRLDRVEDVHPDLHEVVEQVVHVAVGVEQHLRRGPLADERDVVRVDRLEDPPVHRGRHQQANLRAQVVADLDHVHEVAALAQEPVHDPLAQALDLPQQRLGELRLRREVEQERVRALHGNARSSGNSSHGVAGCDRPSRAQPLRLGRRPRTVDPRHPARDMPRSPERRRLGHRVDARNHSPATLELAAAQSSMNGEWGSRAALRAYVAAGKRSSTPRTSAWRRLYVASSGRAVPSSGQS